MLAYNYIEVALAAYQFGQELDESGMRRCAEGFYAIASVSANSLRYAVECLLEMKGTPSSDDGRVGDWDDIAALGWTSPFPYLFEGIILDAKGDSSGAAECYRKAALNPACPDNVDDFKAIKNLDEKSLNGLKAALEELEDRIIEATYGLRFVFIPRDEIR